MSDLAVAVVISLQTRDEATIAELAGWLAELTEESNKADEQELAAYCCWSANRQLLLTRCPLRLLRPGTPF